MRKPNEYSATNILILVIYCLWCHVQSTAGAKCFGDAIHACARDEALDDRKRSGIDELAKETDLGTDREWPNIQETREEERRGGSEREGDGYRDTREGDDPRSEFDERRRLSEEKQLIDIANTSFAPHSGLLGPKLKRRIVTKIKCPWWARLMCPGKRGYKKRSGIDELQPDLVTGGEWQDIQETREGERREGGGGGGGGRESDGYRDTREGDDPRSEFNERRRLSEEKQLFDIANPSFAPRSDLLDPRLNRTIVRKHKCSRWRTHACAGNMLHLHHGKRSGIGELAKETDLRTGREWQDMQETRGEERGGRGGGGREIDGYRDTREGDDPRSEFDESRRLSEKQLIDIANPSFAPHSDPLDSELSRPRSLLRTTTLYVDGQNEEEEEQDEEEEKEEEEKQAQWQEGEPPRRSNTDTNRRYISKDTQTMLRRILDDLGRKQDPEPVSDSVSKRPGYAADTEHNQYIR